MPDHSNVTLAEVVIPLADLVAEWWEDHRYNALGGGKPLSQSFYPRRRGEDSLEAATMTTDEIDIVFYDDEEA